MPCLAAIILNNNTHPFYPSRQSCKEREQPSSSALSLSYLSFPVSLFLPFNIVPIFVIVPSESLWRELHGQEVCRRRRPRPRPRPRRCGCYGTMSSWRFCLLLEMSAADNPTTITTTTFLAVDRPPTTTCLSGKLVAPNRRSITTARVVVSTPWAMIVTAASWKRRPIRLVKSLPKTLVVRPTIVASVVGATLMLVCANFVVPISIPIVCKGNKNK